MASVEDSYHSYKTQESLMERDDDHHGDARGGVQVVSRTAAIMRALSANPGGMSLTAIAKEVDLPRSTVQRLVTALEVEALVDVKGPHGGTRLGPAIADFVASAHADMVVFGRHQLKQLLDEVHETCSIVTAVNARSMVLETMVAEHPLRVVLCEGWQIPLYASAGGKALLAAYGDDLIERFFEETLEPLTSHTLTTREALLAQVTQIREEGVAYARNEFTPGISTLATMLNTSMGIYAFEVAMPDARFDARAAEIKAALLAHRERVLAEAVGFQRDRLAGTLGFFDSAVVQS